MPQKEPITADDILRLLNEKYRGRNLKESATLADTFAATLPVLENQSTLEAQLKGLAELFGLLLTALGIDPRQLLSLKDAPAGGDEEVVGGETGGSSGAAGMGGGGVGGGGAGGGAGGGGGGGVGAGGAGPSNPIADKTPFPAGVATSAPPGSAQRVTVGKVGPVKVPVAEAQQPQAAPEEIPTPNVQSGPAVNVRPNISSNGKVQQ